MSRVDVVHRLEVAPWLLEANDDAVDGRVLVICGCGTACGQARVMRLPAGTWSVEHRHGERWTAHLVSLPPLPSPTPTPTLGDVGRLAAGLAEAFTTA